MLTLNQTKTKKMSKEQQNAFLGGYVLGLGFGMLSGIVICFYFM